MATDKQRVLALNAQMESRIPDRYNGMGQMKEPNCSDIMTIYLTVNPRAMVVDSGFSLTPGACATVYAAAGVAADLARNQPVLAAYTIDAAAIAGQLSDDGRLDKEHLHCAIMAEMALKKAVVDYSQGRRAPRIRS